MPQYLLIGASEILLAVTSLEFFYAEAPTTVRGVSAGLNLLTTALGSWMTVPLLTLVGTPMIRCAVLSITVRMVLLRLAKGIDLPSFGEIFHARGLGCLLTDEKNGGGISVCGTIEATATRCVYSLCPARALLLFVRCARC